MPSTSPPLTRGTLALATIFAGSGTLHLVRPEVYEPIVPRSLPAHRELVIVSGVAELACAAGLLGGRTRRVAGLASAALLVGIFPANVQMSLDHARRARRRRDLGSAMFFAGTVARLPLQWPMIRAALRAAGRT
jgi:uncharacterized membrane protein